MSKNTIKLLFILTGLLILYFFLKEGFFKAENHNQSTFVPNPQSKGENVEQIRNENPEYLSPQTNNYSSLSPDPNWRDRVIKIEWNSAYILEVLKSGEVIEVSQNHAQEVYLNLKDGRILQTMEPEINAIWDEMEKCGEKCLSIATAME